MRDIARGKQRERGRGKGGRLSNRKKHLDSQSYRKMLRQKRGRGRERERDREREREKKERERRKRHVAAARFKGQTR